MSDLSDLVDELIDEERLRFEGEKGVESLNILVESLGYRPSPFKHGTSLEQFLADNHGAQLAIVEWISSLNIPEWIEEIETHLPPPEITLIQPYNIITHRI